MVFGTQKPFSISSTSSPSSLQGASRLVPGSSRDGDAGAGGHRRTHRCGAGCVWRAAGHSRGSSSAPTQTGTCTPPSRCAPRPPRCWSTSGTPGTGNSSVTSHRLLPFINGNRHKRVAGPFPHYSAGLGADTLREICFLGKVLFPICKTKSLYLNC